MKITVNKDNVKIEEFDVVHEGEHRVNKCSFSFSEEYTEELVKKAIFTSQNSSVEVAIINNECDIPTEILKARNIVLLGVYAYKVVDDKLDLRYSPSPDAFKVNSGSYIEGANESEEITPSQFEQYMQAMNDGLNKVEESIKKMDEATSSAMQLVDNINQKLENGDFIGPEGPQGVPGTNGKDGVGITTITSGQSTVEDDKTVTPVIVQKTDGSSQIFNVEAKNGADGKDGLNGKDGVNGKNGQDGTTPNIQIGTVETLEPNEHATVTRTGTDEEPVFNFGIPKGQQGGKGLDGTNGTDGKDATINGQNTVEITTDNNITLDQQESVLKLGLNSQLIPKQDAEGTDNTFNDGLKSPLFALGGDGKSEQVTTTGKNLLPNNITSQIINGVTVTKNDDGSITLNGTATAQADFSILSEQLNLEGEYTFSISDTGQTGVTLQYGVSGIGIMDTGTATTKYTTTFPNNFLGSEYSYINMCRVRVASGVTCNNYTIYPMIESGSSKTSYEPYTGGQPSPSPDYEQPINSIEGSLEFACRGKNLIGNFEPETSSSNGYEVIVNDDNSTTVTGTANEGFSWANITKKKYFDSPIIGDVVFSINKPVKYNVTLRVIYEDDSYVKLRIPVGKTSISAKLTQKAVSSYVYFYLDNELNKIGNINDTLFYQLEQGTQVTEYEPYIEPNEVTFNLNDEKLRSVGDVKDELVVDLDTGDYYKVENIGEYVFDGSEEWILYSQNPNRFVVNIPSSRIGMKSSTCNTMSNYYKYYYSSGGSIPSFATGESYCYQIYDNQFLTPEELKTWLSTHNNILNYELKTPTTKKLGTLSSEDLAKLKTFKGYNNVTVNTNLGLMNIRFTYGLDIKKYVDNKIAQLSEQLIKGE